MKKTGVIACLAAVMVLLSSSFCFGAEAFKVDNTYPVDGQKNTTKDNMVVKLYFNNEVGNKESREANKNTFKITDKKGNEIPTVLKYNPKDSKQAMVLVNINDKKYDAKKIADDTEYIMTLSGDFVDNDGAALGKDVVVKFTTMNQARSTKIYMFMMVIMFAGMFIFTSRSAKHQMKKEEEGSGKEEPFNPYKEAKKTGKSVEEVMAAHEKEQAKKAAKAAKKAARKADDEDEEEYNDNYRVKGPRPISAGGGKYISGRKAIAEAKAAEQEKRKKQAASNKKKK